MSQSLKNVTVKNVSYNAIGKMIAFLFQAVANIILSRELTAEDYGVVGFAMIFVAFMKGFSGFGINKAAVYAKDFNEVAQKTAFTLRQCIGLLAFGITIGISFIANHFVHHPALPSVIRVLALAILVDSFSLVSTIILERNLRFSIISFAETALTVASSITAIILAKNDYKYWSIVYSFIVANFAFVVITYCAVPYRIRFGLDRSIARQFLKYGSTVFLTGLLSFGIMNIDNFIVGSVAGVTTLGYYTIAFNWGAMVATIMGAVVFTVIFPTFTRLKGDMVRTKHAYLQLVAFLSFFSVLCNIGMFCVADSFLISVLGKNSTKWIPAEMTLKILCFYGIIKTLVEPFVSLFMAQGDTRTPLKATLLVFFSELMLVYPAIRFGRIEAVGLAVLMAYCLQLSVYLPRLKQMNRISVGELVKTVSPAFMAGGFMILVNHFADPFLGNGIIKLITSICLLTIVYLLSYGVLTKWRLYTQFVKLLASS